MSKPPYPQYPNAYQLLSEDNRVERPDVFEPALQHCRCAFRKGDPRFCDQRMRDEWYAARRAATDHMLQLVATSAVGRQLVLRGSTLLRTYLGEAAREPGDMDWVVQPESITPDDVTGRKLMEAIRQVIEETASVPGTAIDWGRYSEDDIWLYSRAPGKRITVTWLAPDLPAGNVQLDFVFSERLWSPPIDTVVCLHNGHKVNVRAAGPAQSLAWKIMWLAEDPYAQGKDLYDAVLLAENYELPDELRSELRRLIIAPYRAEDVHDWPLKWSIDWKNFQSEYPRVPGTGEDWRHRLARALSKPKPK